MSRAAQPRGLSPEEIADLIAEAATGDAESTRVADVADIRMEVDE